MKHPRFLAALFLALFPVFLIGCGGGGGGGSTSPTATPTAPAATATPTPGPRVLVVQLRDSANRPVDGIVTVGATVLTTLNGDATFNRNLAAGTILVSAEVDGEVTSASVTVQNSGTTVTVLRIAQRVTPAPSATIPSPPF